MLLIDAGSTNPVRDEHVAKACEPMFTKPLGMSMLDSEMHLAKVSSLMLVRVFGSLTSTKLLQ